MESLLFSDGSAGTTEVATDPRAAAAAVLYPPPAPSPVATAPTAEIVAIRDADPARKVYSDLSRLGPSNMRDLALAISPLADNATLTRQGTELASVAVDLGLNRDDVANLTAYARQFKASPPTAEERAAFHRQVTTDLRAQYGKDFDRVFADARAVSQRDPRWAQFLEASGLGDKPEVIKKMAEAGIRARRAGQLR